jgi:predicted O-methyltransferase YrrM
VIDPFLGNPENVVEGYEEQVPEIFEANIKEIGASDRVELLKMKSISALRHMNLHDDSLDFAYIDGSHVTTDVLMDLCLTWPLVKKGGIIIIDDYQYARLAMDAVPRHAIDIFQLIFRKEIIELHRGWQMIWRKI